MKTQVETVGSLEKKMNVEVPVEVVQAAFQRIYQSIQKQSHIKGFRPGKAPLQTIKNMYGNRVQQDVAKELIDLHFWTALQQNSLDIIAEPEFEFDVPKEGTSFSFTARMELRPEVKVQTVEGLVVPRETLNVPEDRIEKVLANMRDSKAELVDILEDRGAALQDIAVIDYNGFVNGAPLDKGSSTGHQIELGSNQLIEGFEDGIIGMKIGEQRKLQLKFPNPYHASDLAGQPVSFDVKLTGLKKKLLPEWTAELLKEVAGVETLEELKASVRKDMEESERRRIDEASKEAVVAALVKANPVEVPASLIAKRKLEIIADTKKRLLEQGMDEAFQTDYLQKWDADLTQTAADSIRAAFLVDAVAEKFGLAATEADVDAKIQSFADSTGIELSRVQAFYGKPEQRRRLQFSETERRVTEYLLSKSVQK